MRIVLEALFEHWCGLLGATSGRSRASSRWSSSSNWLDWLRNWHINHWTTFPRWPWLGSFWSSRWFCFLLNFGLRFRFRFLNFLNWFLCFFWFLFKRHARHARSWSNLGTGFRLIWTEWKIGSTTVACFTAVAIYFDDYPMLLFTQWIPCNERIFSCEFLWVRFFYAEELNKLIC